MELRPVFRGLPASEVVLKVVQLALRVGKQALDCRHVRDKNFSKLKKDGSRVSIGDLEVQWAFCSLLYKELQKLGRHAVFFGEEKMRGHGTVANLLLKASNLERVLSEKLVVVIDPIQNTRDYLHGMSNWDVTGATLENGQITSGFVYPVEINLLCVAEAGLGLFLGTGPGPEFAFNRVPRPNPWNGDLKKLVVGYGYTISRDRKYRKFWDFLVDNGVETHEVVSTSWGLAQTAIGQLDLYVHGLTFAHDLVAGMATISANNRTVQLLRRCEDCWQLLPGLDVQAFRRDEPSTEVIAGDPTAVSLLTQKWQELVGIPNSLAMTAR